MFDPTAPHPDEAALARLDADMAFSLDAYGPDGPTAADILGDEEIAHLEAARPPADDEGAAVLDGADALARGRIPIPAVRELFAATLETGAPALGWHPWTDAVHAWDPAVAPHLAVHTRWVDRVDAVVHLGVLVAAQLVAVHGPDAVLVLDADPATADTPHLWHRLQDAGVNVRAVAVDPARTVGALAGVATHVRALHHGQTPAAAPSVPRFVVILHPGVLVPLVASYGLAAAARDAVRIITAHGPDHGVHLVTANADEAPPAPAGPVRPAPPVWASLEAPGPDEVEWRWTPDPTASTPRRVDPVTDPARLVAPGWLGPDRVAARLGLVLGQ